MPVQKHVHKLAKHKYPTGNEIFFCTLPDCNYKMEVALVLGKETVCNICDDVFIINKRTLSLNEPHCNSCGRVRMKDENGKTYYIRKAKGRVLTSIAFEKADELRSRLDVITNVSAEDDI